ncbi:uncharacterized protein M421DRAFT_92066 [Didymella exigua CBS 183.55]|uniref:C2H2-type domain-containing protein n=1 Tax=Didymella exigua CBS 183.55 TaxID=1150837 RepID=A0A6A5RUB4_9PLEO|nr:uncharacterized protein M421DRAFT_92066 [Didymella exigua CBS 183.55]KAF1928947.1 hypothetical protein M421DRAFT_92066 [Didymella exigua CBS 183.55]
MPHSQYGMNHYGSSQSSYSSGYPPASQQGYSDSRSSTSGGYTPSYAPSPGHQYEPQQRMKEEQSVLPPYQPQHPSYSHRSYQQQPLESVRQSSSAGGYSYPAPHSNLPSQSMENSPSAYPPPALYPPNTYGMNDYRVSLPTIYPPSSTPAAYSAYDHPRGIPPPPDSNIPALSSSPSNQNGSVMPRVLNSRPKPQCFEHGCNGRQFSTFSNLLRHQREKSGTATKSQCPRCHAEFTRTTAMKGHMQHDKCKARRPSEVSNMSR